MDADLFIRLYLFLEKVCPDFYKARYFHFIIM